MDNVITGGWELDKNMQAGSLPERVGTAWGEIMNNMVGAKYVPILYVGFQIVAGSNHMILSR